MRKYVALGAALLVCSTALAQTSQPAQPSQSNNMPGMNMGSPQKSQRDSRMQQHMQEMQAEMEQMKAQITKMRTDAEKVQDPNTKAALLDNADVWERFMNHVQSHMMQGGMHHGMMHDHGGKGTSTPQKQP